LDDNFIGIPNSVPILIQKGGVFIRIGVKQKKPLQNGKASHWSISKLRNRLGSPTVIFTSSILRSQYTLNRYDPEYNLLGQLYVNFPQLPKYAPWEIQYN